MARTNRDGGMDKRMHVRCMCIIHLTKIETTMSRSPQASSTSRLFCFGSLVILDVARCYLWLDSLYINIKIGKNSC